ncbi:MAG: hypothetical protein N3B13_04245 [Deltaproteobacteria bacterium]|nr:hypothetical protein [Deltaproteobacteria bacterium]
MNNHINQILIDYKDRETALNNVNITTHISECRDCKEFFENYFKVLEALKYSSEKSLPDNIECEKMFETIVSKINEKTKNERYKNPARILRIVAVAASVFIILIAGFLYQNIRKPSENTTEPYSHIVNIFNPEKTDELEIISDFELFSNLDIIENLEVLEELNEVTDDKI